MDNILLFKEISKYDLSKVGFKGLNLATLKHEGLNIPSGYVIISEAFRKFVFETDLKINIESSLSKLSLNNVQAISDEIQKRIMNTEFPEELKEEIIDSYTSLEFDIGKSKLIDMLGVKEDTLVAVRSSYTEEKIDDSKLSQLTLLGVKGKKELLKAVKSCWASLYTKDMILYRQRNKIITNISNAVIVQKMIDAEVSGIVYTSNLESKKKSEILIKACLGLGHEIEKLVCDKYVVDKKELATKEYEINAQENEWYRDKETGEIRKKSIKENKSQKLNDRMIREVARLAKKILTLLNKEQIVEFSVYKDDIYILQSKDLKMDFEDYTKVEKEQVEEQNPEIEIIDLYEPNLEEDLAVLEEMMLQDLEKLNHEAVKVAVEPKRTDDFIKKEEAKQKEDDVLEFIAEVQKRIEDASADNELQKPKKSLDKDTELLSIELIKTLSDKMEKQLREKDFEGYSETKSLLKKAIGQL